jgi:hypothetical protein
MATSTGSIVLLKPESGAFVVAETLCTAIGSMAYPLVFDVDHDGKKDLVVHSEGKGVYVFPNKGSDSMPVLGPPREVTDSSGGSLKDFNGPPLFMDINQTGASSWIIASGGVLKMFFIDSAFSRLTYNCDLNVAGSRFLADSSRFALIGPPLGQPRLATVKGKVMKLFSTHLCGDVNGDGTVDIRDIGRISKLWEVTDLAREWVPLYNLKIGSGGPEVIDIRDISRAGKCWELKE